MLPKINVTTFLKMKTLSRRTVNKIHSISSLNNINSTQSKSQTFDSLNNKFSNSLSKRSKIVYASEKINNINNQNLNPSHKRIFSFITNLSSKANYIYNDFNTSKALPLKQNFSRIKKIIERNRRNELKFSDSLFSGSIHSNKLSQSVSEKNMTNKEKNIFESFYTNLKFAKNNSYRDLIHFQKEKMENLKMKKILKNININNKNNINPKKIITFKEISNNNSPSSNKEKLRFSDLSLKEDKNNIKCLSNRYQEINSFITKLNNKKLYFNINECIFENKGSIKNVSSYVKKILRLKIFQGFQKKKINIFLDENVYELEKYINHIETYFNKYMNICQEYNYIYLNYINFLREKIYEMEIEEKSLAKKEIQLRLEVEKILIKTINTQRKLEKLIDMRNFLYIVRHKDEKIPDIYSTFYIESKRYLLANIINILSEDNKNEEVMKYLITVPQPIPDLSSIDSSEFIVDQSPPLIKNMDNISNINSKESINNNKNIFTSHEEFINAINSLEENNRALLVINKDNLDSIKNYKKILENIVSSENIKIQETLEKIIEIKEKELNKIKKEHLMLLQKYNTYHDMNSKNSKDNLFSPKGPKKEKEKKLKSSFHDLDYFQAINYNILIKRAKNPGLIFFRKLLKSYLNIIKQYPKEIINSETHPRYLKEIITFSTNAEKNPKFTHFLNGYILKLLKLYEFIFDYTYEKNQLYKLEENNLIIMKKQQNIISENRKLETTKAIRKLIETKRFGKDKILIEKWKLPAKIVDRRNYIGNYYGDLIRKKNKRNSEKKRKTIKKIYSLDDCLVEFLDYDDD